jgi:hypothetical protein
VVAAWIFRYRADEDVRRLDSKALVVGEELLVARLLEIWRQGIEPIFRAVNLVERLNALAAAGQSVLIVVGVLAVSDAPLTKVAEALGRTGPGFRATQSWKEQRRQNSNDGDHYEQLQKGECAAMSSLRHLIYFAKYNAPCQSERPKNRMAEKRHWLWTGGKVAAVVAALGLMMTCGAQTTNVTVTPDADTFLRSSVPGGNYGMAGAVTVSGSAATNGSGQQNGLYDSLLRFPVSNVVALANGTFGTNNWLLTRASLRFVELGMPPNMLFNRGVGAFEIRLMATNNWVEGTGTPTAPSSNGVTWNDLATLLSASADISLGLYTNGGVDGPISFNLPVVGALVSAVQAGGPLSLYMTAASTTVGFTADSRNFGTASAWPSLTFTIAPAPAPVLNISTIGSNNVRIAFDTVSNWNYVLQWTADLPGGMGWSNLTAVSAQATNGHVVFVDGATNQLRFYRLSLSP